MEQQTLRIRQLLNTLPKSLLIEMLLAQEITTPALAPVVSEPIEEPTLFDTPNIKGKRRRSNAPISRRRWTEAQDESLLYAVAQGRKSYAEIALMLGRTPEGIHSRLHKLRKAGLA